MTIELTVTVTQMVNNWKEMNELTVTVTQKIWTTVTNCNSKVFVTTVTVTQKKSATQKPLVEVLSTNAFTGKLDHYLRHNRGLK